MRKHRPARRALPRCYPQNVGRTLPCTQRLSLQIQIYPQNKKQTPQGASRTPCGVVIYIVSPSASAAGFFFPVAEIFGFGDGGRVHLAVLRQLNGFGFVLYRVHVRHIVTALDGNGNAVIFLRGFFPRGSRLRKSRLLSGVGFVSVQPLPPVSSSQSPKSSALAMVVGSTFFAVLRQIRCGFGFVLDRIPQSALFVLDARWLPST